MSGGMGRVNVLTIALFGLCLSLGWLVYQETLHPTPVSVAHAPVTTRATKAGPDNAGSKTPGIVLPSIETFDEITSRPLFNASRRPIAVEKPEPLAEKADLNIMLSGIVIGDAQQIAHLRSSTDPHVQALRVGDRIGGWRIEAIEPDRVVLRSGDHVETLYMQKFGVGEPARRVLGQPSGAGVNAGRPGRPNPPGKRIRERYRRNNRAAGR